MAFSLGNSFAALADEVALGLAIAATTTTTTKTQQEQKQKQKKPIKKPQSQAVTSAVMVPPKPLILPEEVLKRNLIFRKPRTINHVQAQALSNNGKNNNNFSNSDKNKKKPEEEEENKRRNRAQVLEAHQIPFPGKFMDKVIMEAKPVLDIEDPIQFPVLGKKM